MKKPVLLISILALLLILVASVTVATATVAPAARLAAQGAPDLEGVRWVLVSYKDSQGKDAAAVPDAPATAEFAGGKVAGTTGCNSYNAPYKVDGNALTVQQTATTMMACAEPVMAQESAYLANLQASATYKVDGEQLTIANAAGAVVLTYKAEKPGSLVGPTWLMNMYNNGKGAFQSGMAGVLVTALFDDKGQLSGNSGCNSYNATYTVSSDTIKIGPAVSTKMACEQAVMDQENAYLNALSQAATFKIEGTKLTLRDAGGAAMVGYVQQPAPAGTGAAPAAPTTDKVYLTLRPAADASVQTLVLNLKADGAAQFTRDFGKEKPILETGTWAESNGLVTVTLTDKDGTKYAAPVVMKFTRDGTFLNLTDYDKAIWGQSGLRLNLAGDVARKLRSSLITFDVSAGFPLDPTFVSVFAGGEVDASLLGRGCAGFISRSPVVTVKWTGTADRLRAFFYSDGDPTLVVLTPKGQLLCNDNASEQILDPFVEVANPVPGEYRIWVGSAKKDDLIPGVLVMTTKSLTDLGTFKLGSLIKRPSIPQIVEKPTTATALNPQVRALTEKLTKAAPALGPGAKQIVDVTAEGEIPLFRIPAASDKGCAGLVTGAPSYAFRWTGPADNLHFGFEGDGDSTLMVVAADSKQVWCNDDASADTMHPAIDIPEPVDDMYLVYVGRVSPNKPVTGKLTIAEAAKE